MAKWWTHIKGAISPSDCAWLIEHARTFKGQEATVVANGKSDIAGAQRQATVFFIPRFDPEVQLLFNQFETWLLQANAQHWGADCQGFHQIQVACYTPGHGHHCWHRDCALVGNDMGSAFDRKITLVAQLSDPSDYEGGQLELEHGDLKPGAFERGDIIIFPSFLKHRVTPVTKGVRYSLATWSVGPKWC